MLDYTLRFLSKNLLLIVAMLYQPCLSICSAQKPLLDNYLFKSWDNLLDYGISNDGRFVWYSYGSLLSGIRVVIRGIDSPMSIRYNQIGTVPKFTADSKYAMLISNDTLHIHNLYDGSLQSIANVKSFDVPDRDNSQWVSYTSTNGAYLMNLSSKEHRMLSSATSCAFNPQGTVLLVKSDTSLTWINLSNFRIEKVADHMSIGDVNFDKSGTSIVFCPNVGGRKLIYYYRSGMRDPKELLGPRTGLMGNQDISFRLPVFSGDSKKVFFYLVETRISHSSVPADRDRAITNNLRLWHYQDEYMQSKSYFDYVERSKTAEILVAVDVDNGSITYIEKPDSTSRVGSSFLGDNFVITQTIGNDAELNWNDKYKRRYNLVSLKNGTSTRILNNAPVYTFAPKLSPGEKFVSWYDYNIKSYVTYEIATGIERSVTTAFTVPLNDEDQENYLDFAGGAYGGLWLARDEGLLVYDKYDIWQIDPYGKKKPINITGGLGRKNNITFRLAANEYAFPAQDIKDTILLAMFDQGSKKNGLCQVGLGRENKPDIRHMVDGIYYFPWLFVNRTPKEPIKAKYTHSTYIIQHMSSISAPNLCVTTDFKSFKFLSDIQPQRQYNWMTVDLIKWRQKDDRELHGLLYKPENFDSTRKYPIIFYYYEKLSQELNLYRLPDLSPGALNIAWYVSNGYLVFIPDIYYPKGRPAKGVVQSVESAIEWLKQFTWINMDKMGLQGHSFGGYETYVLAANTSYFAAAQPSAGVSNFFSGYSASEGIHTHLYEVGQNRVGATPWERFDLYLENSPIFRAANIKTPMLIMHNKGDGAVDFSQALEMYVSLRRQKKPVWLLQYEGEEHILDDPANCLDFNIRQQQFFSTYLKDTPMPDWMKTPISAR